MKVILFALLFATSAFAQDSSVVATAACGPENVSFDLKLDDSQHTLKLPVQGKATVYLIQEKGVSPMGLETKIGLDRSWAGANKNSSYLVLSVEPGEHHLCAAFQYGRSGQRLELAHFTAEAGNNYFYRTRLYIADTMEYFELNPVDSDEAKYLISIYPRSVSQPKR